MIGPLSVGVVLIGGALYDVGHRVDHNFIIAEGVSFIGASLLHRLVCYPL